MTQQSAESRNRLAEVILDEATIPRGGADIDHERSGGDFRPYRGKFVRRSRARRRSLCARDLAGGVEAHLRGAGRQRRSVGVDRGVDDPIPAIAQGLFSRLRDLLFRHPHREPAPDRSDRAPARDAPQRRRRSDGRSASPARSRSIKAPRAGCSRSFRCCAGGYERKPAKRFERRALRRPTTTVVRPVACHLGDRFGRIAPLPRPPREGPKSAADPPFHCEREISSTARSEDPSAHRGRLCPNSGPLTPPASLPCGGRRSAAVCSKGGATT